jgi:hypothetical protein
VPSGFKKHSLCVGLAGKPLIEAARLWNNCGLAKAALKQLELI